MEKRKAWNSIHWTPSMENFLRQNFHHMTNPELAKALGLKLTSVRTKGYTMGLQRMTMQYWTKEQILFLQNNYRKMGDSELAEIFNERWEKEKGWSKKHIEKKRRYLKLKRTNSEKASIKQRNVKRGCWDDAHQKRWEKRAAPIGSVKIWTCNNRKRPYIKTENGYKDFARYMWEYHNGPIANGLNVFHIDGNPLNCKRDNLKLISNAELAMENSPSVKMTDNWIAGILTHGKKENREGIKKASQLIELKRAQLKLNRLIEQHEH